MRFYINAWSCFEKQSTDQVSDWNANPRYAPLGPLHSDLKINVGTLNTVVVCGQTSIKKWYQKRISSFCNTKNSLSLLVVYAGCILELKRFPHSISLCVLFNMWSPVGGTVLEAWWAFKRWGWRKWFMPHMPSGFVYFPFFYYLFWLICVWEGHLWDHRSESRFTGSVAYTFTCCAICPAQAFRFYGPDTTCCLFTDSRLLNIMSPTILPLYHHAYPLTYKQRASFLPLDASCQISSHESRK